MSQDEITPLVNNFANGVYSSNSNNNNSRKSNGSTCSTASQNSQSNTNANTNSRMMIGTLKVTVLSAYDLALREPPAHVAITVNNQIAITGPPIQRHKDRNSFKFGSAPSSTSSPTSTYSNNNNFSSNASITSTSSSTIGSTTQQQQQQQSGGNGSTNGGTGGSNSSSSSINSNEVIISAPLPELYNNIVSLRLVYTNNRVYSLRTEYPINQLNINEPMWLVLRLEPVGIASATQLIAATTSTSSGGVSTSTFMTDDETFAVIPTIRVQMTLCGPYRYEIQTLIALCTMWFNFIDTIEHNIKIILYSITPNHPSIVSMIPNKNFDIKLLLLPIIPIIVAIVVASPILIGIMITLLPIFLPIITVLLFIISIISIVGLVLFISTSTGRDTIGSVLLKPIITTLLSSRVGQRMVYQTGPRPTPVSLARATIIPHSNNIIGRLVVSLLIDAIGSSSYLIPGIGEITDLVWAPIQTILIMSLYDTAVPHLKYISFIEEILPFTDIVPTATIGWCTQHGVPLIMKTLEK